EAYLSAALDPVIHEIVKVRASLINGCAYCLDMHITKLVELDVPQRKINMIATWRETSFFSASERAALALTEEVTEIGGGVYDETWQDALDLFGEKGVSDLVLAITQINVWNRIQIATEAQPPKL
ncbi:MAG: carboxymuconolactone decarboxylase family protein, partial [Microbacteriaceae bacterium]